SSRIRLLPFNTAVAEMLECRRGASTTEEKVFTRTSTLVCGSARLKELGKSFIGRPVTFYDLRHTFFMVLLNNGTDLATISSIGGYHSLLTPLKLLSQKAQGKPATLAEALKKVTY